MIDLLPHDSNEEGRSSSGAFLLSIALNTITKALILLGKSPMGTAQQTGNVSHATAYRRARISVFTQKMTAPRRTLHGTVSLTP